MHLTNPAHPTNPTHPTHPNNTRHSGEARISVLAFALALALALTPTALSQSTLQGRVRDPLGAAVPNATITSGTATTTSGPDGTYTLAATCPCQLRITAPTFAPTLITLPAVQHADLTLATPTRSDQITVTTTADPTPLAQSGAPISVLTQQDDFPYAAQVDQPLRLVPGVQITTTGQFGGQTSLFLRGGNSDFTKVLIDGVPVNDIGSLADLSTLAASGISRIEVLRQPSSVLYGSDVVSGVVSLTTARGTTRLPLFTYAVDGGNLNTLHQQLSIAGALSRLDYASGISTLQTSNSTPSDDFHSTTLFGNYGFIPQSGSDLRFTFRHLDTNAADPNAILLYGIPDLVNQTYAETFLKASAKQQTTYRWNNLIQYGWQAINFNHIQYALAGQPDPAIFATLGKILTIRGANGYAVTGQAQFDYFGAYPASSPSTTRRGFLYAQSDYRFSHLLTALGSFQYESEKGESTYSTASRANYSGTLQLSGDAASRLFYVLGTGIEDNALYGKALTPRASLAYYALRPTSTTFFSGTKLHASFGKGIAEPSVGDQVYSLFGVLQTLPNGPATIAQYNIHPLGGEYSRTYDAGVEQLFGNGRARLNASWFHNQFNNVLEYVDNVDLTLLGIPPAVANNPSVYGAYVNSLAYRAQGAELESELRLTQHLFARAGYTYLDARVQRSFSSDALSPSYNPAFNFNTIPIGNDGPLIGARPFRRAPHSGYFALQYSRSRFNAQLSGTLVGRRDDSTYLGGADPNYGNSLLLPNRNLDGAYQNLTLTADYSVTKHLTTFTTLQNLLNETYQEAFGYPALPITIRGGLKYTFGGESFHLN